MIRDQKMNVKRALTVAMAGGSILFLAGCYERDYYTQRDTISLGAGDAVATNANAQTIDPWPPHAKDTDIDLEGPRAVVAVDRYQTNTSLKPKGLSKSISPVIYPGGAGGPSVID
ncbi:MAG: pilus assembly protein [Hyphomicrobiales bacterium]|nr:pilus assembly protein [Hyphomicrobiales bacterium]